MLEDLKWCLAVADSKELAAHLEIVINKFDTMDNSLLMIAIDQLCNECGRKDRDVLDKLESLFDVLAQNKYC